jgi:hypothetical protein
MAGVLHPDRCHVQGHLAVPGTVTGGAGARTLPPDHLLDTIGIGTTVQVRDLATQTTLRSPGPQHW